ncbi:MAG TPA: AsmA-like C-terminal domain-containing protein, partial [Burkholderiales bacterium]|nr:AsmA-like C-terminal domain-containing protein [Burkholderiales bacterium]
KVRFLPSPRGTLRGVDIDIPGVASGRAESVDIHLRLLPLFKGSADIASVDLVRPAMSVHLSTSSGPSGPAPDPIVAYRTVMAHIASTLNAITTDASVTIEDGSLDLHIEGAPPIDLRGLQVHARTDAKTLSVEASAACNLWKDLALAARVQLSDYRGQATLDVSDLRPQALLNQAVPAPMAILLPSANLHADGRTDGKTSIDAGFIADVPAAEVKRGERSLQLSGVKVKGNAALTDQRNEITLSEIRFGDLLPVGQATLRVARGAATDAELDVRIPELALSPLRDAAVALAGDDKTVSEYAKRVHGGSVSDLHFGAKAKSLDDLFALPNLTAAVTLADGAFVVPELEREATNLAGHVELRDGKLVASAVSGRLDESRVADANGEYNLASGDISVTTGFDLALAPTLAIVRGLLSKGDREAIAPIRSIKGRAQGRGGFTWHGRRWGATISVAQSDSRLETGWLPWPMAVKSGTVELEPGGLKLTAVNGSIGRSTVSDANTQFSYSGPFRIDSGAGKVTVALDELYPWLRSLGGLRKTLEPVKSVTGKADVAIESLSGDPAHASKLQYEGTVEPHDVRVHITALPAPVTASGGSVRVTPSTLTLAGVDAALLDLQTKASGKVFDYTTKRLKVDGSVAEGTLGPKFVDWLWREQQLHEELEPKAPVQFAAQRVQWSLAGLLDAQVSTQFASGPKVGVDIEVKNDIVDLRRITIKDKRTDATLALRIEPKMLNVHFAGSMDGETINAMLKYPGQHIGHGSGDLRVSFDREHAENSRGAGRFTGENMNIGFLVDQPMILQRLDLEADAQAIRVKDAEVTWAGQPATIKGDLVHGESGPVVNAELQSSGIVLDALLPAAGPEGEEVELQSKRSLTAWIWDMPIKGQGAVNSDFGQYKRMKVAPLRGTMMIGQDHAHLSVTEAQLCGLSFPLQVDATPQGITASTQISAQDLGMQKTAQCFTGERILISGRYDLMANLETSGDDEVELVKNLKGPIKLAARKGKVMKFALLGNILKLKNISNLLQKGGPQIDDKGFPYKSLAIDAHLGDGRATIDQMTFVSDAVGLVANGNITVPERDTHMTVLVAPFGALDRLVRSIPLIGYVIGGAFTSVPVSVTGDIRDPAVVPLGPRAVGSELLGIFERTLKLPSKMLDFSSAEAAAK